VARGLPRLGALKARTLIPNACWYDRQSLPKRPEGHEDHHSIVGNKETAGRQCVWKPEGSPPPHW
jgi:hypothetical protein